MGYIMRYGGGLSIVATALRATNNTMLPEEYIGGVLAGGMVYLIGDRMGQREIAKRQLHLDEMRAKLRGDLGRVGHDIDRRLALLGQA